MAHGERPPLLIFHWCPIPNVEGMHDPLRDDWTQFLLTILVELKELSDVHNNR